MGTDLSRVLSQRLWKQVSVSLSAPSANGPFDPPSASRAGRPTSNGCVERVQQTLLEKCWKPAFALYLTPKYTGLQRDLVREPHIYNTDRAHQGRRTKGLTPKQAPTDPNIWL